MNKPELQLVSNEKKDGKDAKAGKAQPPVAKAPDDDDADDEEDATAKGTGLDPIKIETLNVLNDLIDLQRTGGKGATASATTLKQNQQ